MLPKHAMFPAFSEFSVLELAMFELTVTVIAITIAMTVVMTIVSVVRHMVSTSCCGCCSRSTCYNRTYPSVVMSCNIKLVFLIDVKSLKDSIIFKRHFLGVGFREKNSYFLNTRHISFSYKNILQMVKR